MKTRVFLVLFLFTALIPALPSAHAETYELKTMTPAVQKALDGRQARYGGIQALKADGKVGENQRGYVVALDHAADIRDLTEAENADRRAIYQAIAQQNNLGDSGLAIVEAVFAEVQQERAQAGERIQRSTGEWIRKS